MTIRSLLAAGAAIAALGASAPAAALTIVQNTMIADAAANAATPFSFTQFDSLLGTLNSVTLEFTATMPEVSGTLTNNPGASRTFTLTRGINTAVTGNGFTNLSLNLGTGSSSIGPLAARASVPIGAFAGGSGTDSETLTGDLSAFIGAGNVNFSFARTSLFSINPSSGTLTISPHASATATLTYDYTAPPPPPPPPVPVPEPGVWALMILGFGTVGATLRRRKLVPLRVRA
jgi:hypothetical protein